jgi:hypothetical protein
MSDQFIDALHNWQNFYLLVGGAAATLTGLLFVAISLGVTLSIQTEHASARAYVTPAFVHFAIVLFISAFCIMPIQRATVLGVLILFSALVNLIDTGASVRYLWRQWQQSLATSQDWFWRAALPLASSLALIAAGIWLIVDALDALSWLAGVTLVLLAMAIRNAWDLLTWIVEHRDTKSSP